MSGKTCNVCLRWVPATFPGPHHSCSENPDGSRAETQGARGVSPMDVSPGGGGASNTGIGQLILKAVACSFMEELSLWL